MDAQIRTEGVDYLAPKIADYGDLTELTEALADCGRPDGSAFATAHTHAC
jgi:hypothetical protein